MFDAYTRPVMAALCGIGQIVLQGSAWTGGCIVLALLWQEPTLALGCALGALVGQLTARGLRLPAEATAAGLHGFNGALVGTAAAVFFAAPATALMVGVVGAALATALALPLARALRLPAYTAPFIVATWAALAALGLPDGGAAAVEFGPREALLGVFAGAGQIVFAADPLAGGLVLAGIAFGTPRHALWALAGSALGLAVGWATGAPGAALAAGLYGYSAALAAVALADRGWRAALAGIVLAAALHRLGAGLGWPLLTAPFVLATWAVLLGVRLVAVKDKPAPS